MRPRELRLSGFRSYRAEQTVDFSDLGLVAIIGDTGAGKSSLLEAMTWALYGASTWSKRSSAELLAHGAKRMTVALHFDAAGERWRVTRTYARTGAPSAVLECVSDATRTKIDGVRQVDPALEALLGLSYEVFCSCVLLPQGKFERLLKATSGERTDVLKSILRLEQLGERRDLADRRATRVAERERELLAARGRFRPNPAADASRATSTLAALEPEDERLAALGEAVKRLDEACRGHDEAQKAAHAAAERVAVRRDDRSSTLEALAERDAALRGELELAHVEAQAARTASEAAGARYAEAARAGLDPVSLAARAGELEQLGAGLDRRARLARDLDDERRAAAHAEAAVRRAASELESADEDLETRRLELGEARAEAERAGRQLAGAYGEATELTAALAAVAERDEQAHDAHATLTTAERDREGSSADLEAAQAAATTALEERDRLRDDRAAAHVAARCQPGEPCPVCRRELTADFVAPVAPELDQAEAAARGTDRRLTLAREAERTASLGLAGARERNAAAGQALSEARSSTAAKLRAASWAPGLEAEKDGADVLDGALSRLATADAAARAAFDDQEARREQAEATREAAVAGHATAIGDQVARLRGVEQRTEALATLEQELIAALHRLPEFLSLPGDPDALTATGAEEARASLQTRRDTATQLENERDRARVAAHAAADRVREVELSLEREVATPTATAREGLRGLVAELPAERLAGLSALDAHAAPAELATLAAEVERRADAHTLALGERARLATETLERDRQTGHRLLAEAGFVDRQALAGRGDQVRAEVLAARTERDDAGAQIAAAIYLDALIERAARLRGGLLELKAMLSDGAFVAYVIAKRQRALLAHASRVLEDITRRYAFTEDFRILDGESGLPRSPDTLSGGETFIAALALALGLVEVADRSGGDLRALFLDEGFGSLDATVLDTALTALEERASSGRLIGVISHVPTVAERIDTVLEVRSAVEGSTVRLLDPAEREARVLDGFADPA